MSLPRLHDAMQALRCSGSLPQILDKHDATMKCQFDAFADYVAQAEADGVEGYPLYEWTKATIEDPVKKAKHSKSFAIHIKGREVYTKEEADAIEVDLQPLVDGARITRLSRHDTNPARASDDYTDAYPAALR
jgi:hypothetical protein